MAKKKKIRKNKYTTPASRQKKPGVRLPFAFILKSLALLVSLAGFCVLLVLSYSWITQTPLFETKKIEVTGIKRLKKPEILKQADIKFGMNIFKMNLSLIRTRLLAHPWIKKTELIRIMPDTLKIIITEHIPHATIAFDKKYIMNKEGKIFKKYSDDLKELPLITGLLPEDINIAGSDLIKPETKQHKAVMELLKIQAETFVKISEKKVHTIHVDHELGLTLFSDGQIKELKLGFSNYCGKLRKLEDLVKFVTKNDKRIVIEKIDLVNIKRIVIKPANTTAHNNFSFIKSGGYNASS